MEKDLKEDNVTIEDNEKDYLAEIENLKNNTVARDQYNKILEDNKRLIQTIARNEDRAIDADNKSKANNNINLDECREKLFKQNSGLKACAYFENALNLRKGLIEKGEPDPFIPIGNRINPTAEDIETANKVAEGFQSCLDYAEGDDSLFVQELQRITKDVGPQLINNKRRY